MAEAATACCARKAPAASLDRGGWCAKCNRENGWLHLPAAGIRVAEPTPTREDDTRG